MPDPIYRAGVGSTLELLASAAKTVSGQTAALSDFGHVSVIRAALVVTAITAGTLDVVVEDTLDGTNWFTVGTFTQVTAATTEVINIGLSNLFADLIRVRWTIVTGPATFGVRAYLRQ